MKIIFTNTGKRYNREWIFRHFTYEFITGKSYAITGPNGSGKSTLLQLIGGDIHHNEGNIHYFDSTHQCPNDQVYRHIGIAAPYLELVEEMTTKEFLEFHSSFKPLQLPITDIIKIIGLEKATNKQIRYFSSGMKQRLKLAQAIFGLTRILLLDEPLTNLDAEGISLYHQLIHDFTGGKLVIVSSNDKQEYNFCKEIIEIGNYK